MGWSPWAGRGGEGLSLWELWHVFPGRLADRVALNLSLDRLHQSQVGERLPWMGWVRWVRVGVCQWGLCLVHQRLRAVLAGYRGLETLGQDPGRWDGWGVSIQWNQLGQCLLGCLELRSRKRDWARGLLGRECLEPDRLASDLVRFDLVFGLEAGWTVSLRHEVQYHRTWCRGRVGLGCFLLAVRRWGSQVDQRAECLMVIRLLSRVERIVRLG